MSSPISVPEVNLEALRCEIRKEYAEVAANPGKGFHFHTGWPHASQLGYRDEWLAGVPPSAIESFAGTGNPFAVRAIKPGEKVVDLGSGAGIDSFIAARMVGADGHVVGIDMTPEMLAKAREAVSATGLSNIEFREGHAEELPVEEGWADVVISNGVLNLCPDKLQVLREIFRVLRPGGRIQMADISVQKPVADAARRNVDLWKG
jgi:SAM-dependent methyltransferase